MIRCKRFLLLPVFALSFTVIMAQTGTKNDPVRSVININTTAGHAMLPGASGFNARIGDKVWGYKHPDFVEAVKLLKPGWLRYWSGTAGDAFCMGTGLYDKEYLNMFDKGDDYEKLYRFIEVKGPQRITDLYKLMGENGGRIVVTINGFTESPEMTAELAMFCKNNNIVVDAWQFCNEPYFYIPTRQRYWWNDGYDYAQKMKPHADAIKKVFPAAKLALNFTWDGIWPFMKEISRYQQEQGAYWNTFSKHSYAPHVGGEETFEKAYQRANTKLPEVTGDAAMQEIETFTKPGIPMLITEFGVWNKPLNGIYSAIYNAEYTLRQLSHSNAYMIGSHEISNKAKPAKNLNKEILQAYEDGKDLNTDTLRTGIQVDDEGKAMQLVHEATNNSNYIFKTTITGASVVDGMKGNKEEGNYAMAFRGVNGYDYLAISNRSGNYQQVAVTKDDQPLHTTFERQYMWSAEAQHAGIPVVADTVSGSRMLVPPYSFMMVKWRSGKTLPPLSTRIYDAKVVKDGIALSWWKREAVSGYELSYTTGDGKMKKIKTGAKNSFVVKGLTPGQQYHFTVTGINAAGSSEASEEVVIRYAIPAAPVIFKTAPRDNEVTVLWHSVAAATAYKVVVRKKDGSWQQEYDADNVFGYKIKNLGFDTAYLVAVKAYNGLGESAASTPVTVTCKKNIPLPAYNISAIENADGSIALQWDPPTQLLPGMQYRLYRGEALYQLQPFAENITDTTYTDTTVSKGKNYFYSVKAYTADGENSFFPNTATIIHNNEKAYVNLTEIGVGAGTVTISVAFDNISTGGDVVYGVTLQDVSYLNGEEITVKTAKVNGKTFTVTLPANKLVKGRSYAVKAFVQTNGGTPVTSLPPLKQFVVN